jgi:cellobiose transport system substrate-binding protein
MAALLAALALLTAACNGGDEDASGEEPSDNENSEPVTLQFWLFGNFGEESLIAEYEEMNENVTIETTVAEFNAHHDALTTALAAGAGGPDIAAVEVGFMSRFLANPTNFVNLLDYGAAELEGDFLEWKWRQALTGDESALIGLGTDVGGLAMAYRIDLFEEAGLPSDREEVAALWPTWEDFIAVGEDYVDATGRAFIDESSQLYNAVINQADQKYYTPENEVVIDSNPAVREAWDLACEATEAGITANIEPFAEGWNAAMTNGDFAALTAPAWMMGYIQGQAPDTEGNWDIAALPGGGGNWGGSHLAIPSSSEHPQEAYDFISWFTAPEQQLKVFQEVGNFPSTPELYDTPDIQEFSNPFFNDAPVGPIFAENVQAVVPVYEGPDEGPIRQELESGLDQIEDGQRSCDEAWDAAVENVLRDFS